MLLEEYSWFHTDPVRYKGFKKPLRNPLQEQLEEEAVREVRYVAYGVVAPIIVSIGLVGNILVIALLRLPQFKGVVFSFFTVLAVADLLSLGFCISPLHHALAGGTLHYSTAAWYSYFELLFVGAAMSTSVLIVVCITVHRFFSVCRPGEFHRLNTPRFPRISMAAALGTAVIAWLPMSFLRQPRLATDCQRTSFTPPDNQTWWVACMIHDTSQKGYFIAYAWIRQVLVTFLPIVAVVTLNLFTLRGFLRHRKLRHRMLSHQANQQPSSLSKSREEKYLMGLLIAVMTSFVITIVPSGVANAINSSTRTSELEFVIFSAVANNLEILNHTLNFYLYILCSKQVRETLKEYYKRHRNSVAWVFDGLSMFSREVRSETSGGRGGEQRRDSQSPSSKTKTEEDPQKIFTIASPSPALSRTLDSTEENRQNEAMQDNNIFPHVIANSRDTLTFPNGVENPNFEYSE